MLYTPKFPLIKLNKELNLSYSCGSHAKPTFIKGKNIFVKDCRCLSPEVSVPTIMQKTPSGMNTRTWIGEQEGYFERSPWFMAAEHIPLTWLKFKIVLLFFAFLRYDAGLRNKPYNEREYYSVRGKRTFCFEWRRSATTHKRRCNSILDADSFALINCAFSKLRNQV